MESSTDKNERLLSADAHGDTFESFYRASWWDVYRVLAVVLRNADLAEEAADEGMTRAFHAWPKVSGHANPAGWVYVVSLNWARSMLRRSSRTVFRPDPPEEGYTQPMPDPDLDRAVAGLPIRQREVVVLRYMVGMSQREIADLLGVAEGTVKSRIGRALVKLRKEVDS